MCMKYEAQYQECFDHLFYRVDETPNLYNLLEEYNVRIVDQKEFAIRIIKILEELHELGIIRPEEVYS